MFLISQKQFFYFYEENEKTWVTLGLPFKRQFHKMVKHTQTIRRQFPDELFECVWPFRDIGA